MGIYNVNAIPGDGAQVSSAFGGVTWDASPSNISAQVPAGFGTTWRVWKVQIPGAIPGQPFNGVRIGSGTVDFTVGGGGTGILRYASFYVNLGKTLAVFVDAAGQNTGAAIQGSGVGRAVDSVITDTDFTSDDLIAGTFFLGVAGSTGSQDIGLGDGILRTSAFGWTFYTGGDLPTPEPGVPTAYLTNSAGNQSGVLPGGQFAGVQVNTTNPANDQFIQAAWVLGGGTNLSFVVGGGQGKNQEVGLSGPTPGTANCGAIAIAPNTPPGIYTLTCNLSGYSGFFQIQLSTNLVVQAPSQGGFFFEI